MQALSNGTRRSTRHRVRPLEYWRNEKVVYSRKYSSKCFPATRRSHRNCVVYLMLLVYRCCCGCRTPSRLGAILVLRPKGSHD
jgi:hypothetical protein